MHNLLRNLIHRLIFRNPRFMFLEVNTIVNMNVELLLLMQNND